jgi:fructan beta-fructosidase
LLTTFLVAVSLAAASEEPLRPSYHFSPPQNFMNDPNGLVFLDGEYHLFYQHNPQGDRWGHMSWGHAVSRDLLHWEHLPLALAEENGIMIFSGSAVADPSNTSGLCGTSGPSCLIAIYTGHTEKKQTQNLAFSPDRGRTWTKYEGNPVVDLTRTDHRDPKVFWHEPTKRWIMVTVLADARLVRFLASTDLKHWETLSDFGPQGSAGGAWECPDLFELPVEGAPGERRWVLDVDLNPGGRVGGSGGQYFVGQFDGRRFVNENADDLTLWVDYGKDFYASQSYSGIPSDGRRVWVGWMSNWMYADVEPTSPWRGVQSLPRELALRRTPSGIRLVQAPVREVALQRATTEPRRLQSRTALSRPVDIEIEVTPGTWSQAGIRFSNSAGEEAVVGVKAEPLEIFVDRRKSRTTTFHDGYAERHSAIVRWLDGRVTLRVIFDRTTIEAFANGGERVISDRVYPTQPFDRIEPIPGGTPDIRFWELR